MKKTAQGYEEWKAYQREWFKTPRGKYHVQKSRAKERGIPFLLTFEEWWDIWLASGKWEQRGRRSGQYAMARPGDQGPYARGNIEICLVQKNVGDSNQHNYNPVERRSASMKAWWATASEEKRDAMSRAMSENNGSHRPEVRAKQSAAAKTRWQRPDQKKALAARSRDWHGRLI